MIPWILLALACGGGDPPPDKIQVVSGQIIENKGVHVTSAEGSTFDQVAFTCCSTEPATAVTSAFIGLAEAMAGDDEALTVERLGTFRTALTGAEDTDAIDSALASIAGSTLKARSTLKDLRGGFSPLSDAAIAYADAHRGGSERMAVTFCPMAPGRWLQTSDQVRNPYYGAQMLKCGVFEPVPPTPTAAQKEDGG